jgi:hypothetical protein
MSDNDNDNHDDNPIMVGNGSGGDEEELPSSPSSQQPSWSSLDKKILALKIVPVVSFLLMTIIVGATTLRQDYDQFAWMKYQVG